MSNCCDEPQKTVKGTSPLSFLPLIGGIFISVAVIFGIILATSGGSSKLTQSANAQVYNDHLEYAWGEIGINSGEAVHEFEIENRGTNVLELTNVLTSCACTTARITIEGKASPYFGMHSTSSWIGRLEPGQTATLSVVFDPLFHGPDGLGPIERFIAVETNDPQNPRLEFKLTGNVVKKD